jgi:hypothetical protein
MTGLLVCLLRLRAVKAVFPPRQIPRLPISNLTAPTHFDPSASTSTPSRSRQNGIPADHVPRLPTDRIFWPASRTDRLMLWSAMVRLGNHHLHRADTGQPVRDLAALRIWRQALRVCSACSDPAFDFCPIQLLNSTLYKNRSKGWFNE